MKLNNPTCPFDRKECSPNHQGFAEMDGYLNCNECSRYHNGVRETGALKNLEVIVLGWKSIVKQLNNIFKK